MSSQLKVLYLYKNGVRGSHTFSPLSQWNDLIKRAMSGGVTLKEEHKRILEEVKAAQEQFYHLTQEDADRIFQKVAQECNRHRLPLAKLAALETGMV